MCVCMCRNEKMIEGPQPPPRLSVPYAGVFIKLTSIIAVTPIHLLSPKLNDVPLT